jgi:hypothetical protein
MQSGRAGEGLRLFMMLRSILLFTRIFVSPEFFPALESGPIVVAADASARRKIESKFKSPG